ncbi:hypothetical protein [Demetria terragena]|uniref:hypothetical protein n=1 Tax=Demetria terragena TaxID=63959 RepID=UPI000377F035|nr:hypothetical protein [Demetria terragena]
MVADVVGALVAVACISVVFFASRLAAIGRSEFSDSSFRTFVYLAAGGFAYNYPVGEDAVRWMLFVLIVGVGLGYFSRKVREPT